MSYPPAMDDPDRSKRPENQTHPLYSTGPSYSTRPDHSARPEYSTRPAVVLDAGRLWTGGIATALVAALVAILGLLVARGLLDIPLLAPTEAGTLGDASSAWFAFLAAVAALLATGLMHLLLLTTPRPGQFFTAIMVLVTLIAAVLPFLTGAELDTKIATSAIVVIIGTTIGSLISGVARTAVRRAPRPTTGY